MNIHSDLFYVPHSSHPKHQLDVYAPVSGGPFPILLFVHGGSWYNGSKDWYEQLGRHLAQKNVVCAVINYRLGEEASYEDMASDVAMALKWMREHGSQYQGDPQKLFIAGHSAGGHLSALVTLNPRFLQAAGASEVVIKGCLLLDAFGLNMDYVMQHNQVYFVTELQKVFGKDPEKWKDAAPVRFVHPQAPPFLLLVGAETYPHLAMDNEVFRLHLEEQKVPFRFRTVPGKNHAQMITAFKDMQEPMYRDLLDFMEQMGS